IMLQCRETTRCATSRLLPLAELTRQVGISLLGLHTLGQPRRIGATCLLGGAGREPGLAHRIDKYCALLRCPALAQCEGFYIENSGEPSEATSGKRLGLLEPA